MGVKGLAAWLARTYPEAFVVQAPPDDRAPARFGSASATRPAWARRPVVVPGVTSAPAAFDCVYVDMASVLHTAMRKANDRDHFAILVFARLDALLAATSPRHVAVLALDGPAPLAKLLTQRARRRRAGRREAGGRDSGDADGGRPSSLSLTPGAPLMQFVAAALQYYVCSRLARYHRFRGLAIELSGADVPGEGELKCVARLVAPWAAPAAAAGSHCLVGGDSDLLLMAACAPARGPVFVMVDDPRGGGGGGRGPRAGAQAAISSRSESPPTRQCDPAAAAGAAQGATSLATHFNSPSPGTSAPDSSMASPRGGPPPRVLSVAAFDAAAARALGPAAPATPAAAASLRRDLTVLAVAASGNDYLPAVSGGATLGRAWGAYVRRARAAVAAGEGGVPPIVRVDDDAEGGGVRVTLDPDALADVLMAGGVERGGWGSSGGDGADASSSSDADAPVSDDDDARPPADPAAYATGLAWVLSMYVTGACGDHRYVYDGRGPRVVALVAALRARGGAPVAPPYPPRPPLSPRVCAAALLPPGDVGRDAAPAALARLWDADSPVADLTAGCAVCDALSAESSANQRRYVAALHAVRALTGEEGEGVEAAAEAAVEKMKDRVRADAARRRAHVRAAHPYAPFPTARLEAAVAAALGGEEDAFGEAALFWRPVGGAQPPARVPGAAAAAPCPLPPPPAARMPELDPVRPPVVRVRVVGMVGGPSAVDRKRDKPPPFRRQRAAPPPRRPARPPRKPAAPTARASVFM